MIRATVIATIDQACLSALNFCLASAFIHFATKEQYGLYAQLTNLQSFFSPLNAGVFVSAYLAIASKMGLGRRAEFKASMSRAEVIAGLASSIVVVVLCSVGSARFGYQLNLGTCVAFGFALLGLWWKEFIRIVQFTELRFGRALRVDAVYCVATSTALILLSANYGLNVGVAFLSLGLGAIAAAVVPLCAVLRSARPNAASTVRDFYLSWTIGKWDVVGSIVTWGYQQSYIYFAAGKGGLDAAAEIAAARLLVSPLALLWASFANVLRPRASRLLSAGSNRETSHLAKRSAVFVFVSSLGYLAVLLALLPIMEKTLFGGKFEHLEILVCCWTAYIALAGISTVASSILRSALEFRQIFNRQVVSCIAAIGLLAITNRFVQLESIVIVLVIIEATSAALLWHRLGRALAPFRK